MVAGTPVESKKFVKVADLEDSAPLLADPEALRKRWAEDGALFFKNVLDKDAVAKVRDEYVRRLKAMGLVAADADPAKPVWTGVDKVDGAAAESIDDSLWRELATHASFDHLISTLLDEPPAWLPIVVYRASHPLSPEQVPADAFGLKHQDGFFNKGIDFITCWVPLMTIDDEVGGLAVVPGGHLKPSLHDPSNPPVFPIPAGAIRDEEWRRGDYEAGDVLVFHNGIAHAGLPNQSDLFRLSLDIRFLRSSAATPIAGRIVRTGEGTVTILDESGTELELTVTEDTYVRGPKGARVYADNYSEVLFEGNAVMAVADQQGEARLVRTSSRRYLDLPHTWYSELPPTYVV